MAPQFVVTPWRDAEELFVLRRDLYGKGEGSIDRRERGVNQVLAWRIRKPELPLLLESTADIVSAILQDEQDHLPLHAIRLIYATAISRFITGLLDTASDLARLALPYQTVPILPTSLRETRHRIVHRHLPSLHELKRAAAESLAWLWENYWSHLDALLAPTPPASQLSQKEVKERIQGVLKIYVKDRKSEIKSRSKDGKAGDVALGGYLSIDAPRDVKVQALLDLLVQERQILPVGKKLGTSMAGAFLIWTPLLVSLGTAIPSFCRDLLGRMVDILGAPTREGEEDPVKEGMGGWVVHILTSAEWKTVRSRTGGLMEEVLGLCFTTPTFWTLKLAENLLEEVAMKDKASWRAILDAAKHEGEHEQEGMELTLPPRPAHAPDKMEADTIDIGIPVSETKESNKTRGPQKYAGLWRPQPIGWIPPGWDVAGST